MAKSKWLLASAVGKMLLILKGSSKQKAAPELTRTASDMNEELGVEIKRL